MALVRFENVDFTFNSGVKALSNITFDIEPGEFVFLVGPSGAGKTTILRLLLREILPQQGSIYLEDDEISRKRGVSVPSLRKKIGTSFQDVKLLLDRTIEENIALAMEIAGKKTAEIKEAVESVLDLVGLQDRREMFPVQLSGGELQRIGIARAVVGDPLLIFADEPTANLDEEATWKIASLLKEINRSGKTVLVATHNVELVDSMGERVLRLENGVLKDDRKKGKYHSETKK